MFLGSLLAVSFPVPVGSVLVLPEVYRFMDFSGRRLLVCFPYSVLLGSTVDTRLASVYEALGRISRSSRV